MPDKKGDAAHDVDNAEKQERQKKFEEKAKADLVRSIHDFGLGYGDVQSLGPMNAKSSPEALDAVALAVRRLADRGDFHNVYTLLRYVPARAEDVQIPALQQWVAERIAERYAEFYLEGVQQMCEVFHVTPETKKQFAVVAVKRCLESGRSRDGMSLSATAGLGHEFLLTPEIQEAARRGIVHHLQNGDVGSAFACADGMEISIDEIKSDENNREAAWAYIYDRLSDLGASNMDPFSFDKILQIAKDFPLVDRARTAEESAKTVVFFSNWLKGTHSDKARELLRPTTKELQGAARLSLINNLQQGYIEQSIALKHEHNLPESTFGEPEVQEAAKKGVMHALVDGRFEDSAVIEERCFISEEEMQRLALEAALASLEGKHYRGKWQNAIEIVEHFKLDVADPRYAEKFHFAARDSFTMSLASGDVPDALVKQRAFQLTAEECRDAAVPRFEGWLKNGAMEKCVAIKNAFGLPANIFAAPEMRTAAKTGMQHALYYGYTDNAYVLEDLCALSDDDVTEASTKALIENLKQGQITDAARDIIDLFHPNLQSVSPKDVPFKVLVQLAGEKGFAALAEQDPWHDGVAAMLKVQARAAKAEHDPWLTDMVPLVEKLLADGVVQREKPEDAEVLLDYVKMFGMYNLPQMAKVFLDLKRGQTFAQLSPDVQQQLRAIVGRGEKPKDPNHVVGKKAERMDGEQIINELRRFRRDMQGELLADEIPGGIDTAIGEEIFAGLKGDTSWGRSDRPRDIVQTWRVTEAQGPDVAKLPEGYREHPVRVPLLDRREKIEKQDEAKERKEKTAKLLARGTKEKPTELGACFSLLEGASAEFGDKVDRKAWWEGKRIELAATLAYDDSGMEKALAEREAQLKEKNNPPEKIAKILDGVRAGYAKKRAEAAALQNMLRGLDYPNGSDDAAFVAFLEKLSGLRRETAVRQVLLTLSAEHIRRIVPEWGTRLDGALKNAGGAITVERVTGLHDVYVQYINEHYLNKKNEHHTGHVPFSSGLHDALMWAYGVPKDMDGHVLSKTRAALDALEKGDVTVSDEAMTVTLVPVHGLLRIYSGDIGDSCTANQHASLAQGKVPDLHAVMFVTNRSTAQERLQGSVLFVETRTPDGENVLLVRANNPQENLINQVDAEALVKATIDAAIATAKARGIRIVAVPLDAARASCSNRSAVAEYYKKHYATAKKIALVDEDETNFNGYNNWDPNDTHPSVVVWRV